MSLHYLVKLECSLRTCYRWVVTERNSRILPTNNIYYIPFRTCLHFVTQSKILHVHYPVIFIRMHKVAIMLTKLNEHSCHATKLMREKVESFLKISVSTLLSDSSGDVAITSACVIKQNYWSQIVRIIPTVPKRIGSNETVRCAKANTTISHKTVLRELHWIPV